MNYQTEISLLTKQIDRLLAAYQEQRERADDLQKALAAAAESNIAAQANPNSMQHLDRIIAEVEVCIASLKEE
jgi:hypothetical protein